MIGRPPSSPLFPSTPLFRSRRLRCRPFVACRDRARDRRRVVWLLCRGDIVFPADNLGRTLFRTHRPTASEGPEDRKSTRLNSSHTVISYAVFCLQKKKASTT